MHTSPAVAAKPPSGAPATLADVAGRGGQLAALDRLIADAHRYRDWLADDPAERRRSTQHAWLDFCESICRVVPDGDAAEAASQARFDLGLDEEGRPTDEFGWSLFEFNPSMVHPDNPAQSAGRV